MATDNEYLSTLNQTQLFAEIGRALRADEFGSVRLTDAEAAPVGESWFSSVLPAIRSRVCGNETIEKLLLTPTATARNTALLAAVQAALTGLFHGIPLLTIAHAVVCYGIRKLCEHEKHDS